MFVIAFIYTSVRGFTNLHFQQWIVIKMEMVGRITSPSQMEMVMPQMETVVSEENAQTLVLIQQISEYGLNLLLLSFFESFYIF